MRTWEQTKAAASKARSELAGLKAAGKISDDDWRCLRGYLRRLEDALRQSPTNFREVDHCLDTLQQGLRLVRANGRLDWYGPD